jgi:histidine ammonia-lyase
MKTIYIGDPLDFSTLGELMFAGNHLALSTQAIERIQNCKSYLDQKLADSDKLFYGINTGFGALCDIAISKNDLSTLQRNLVMSHACGTGAMVPDEIVRLMLVLKVQSLAYGHSGVQLATVQRLIDLYNHDVLPVVYEQGSLGASGDLAPLAHLSLPLLGLGEVRVNGEITHSASLNATFGWEAITLQAKEGLALLNGTQFMTAYGVYAVIQGERLLQQANMIAALSMEAFDCRTEPFHPLVHEVRPHTGQQLVAATIREWLKASPTAARNKVAVQDPYSFRCIPQVHGASYDTWLHAASVFETEMNAVSDNPNLFPEEDLIISGGNFHGQPLAFALDFLAIALAELGSISERRTYQLISGSRGLPAFLIAHSGLNSGMMIPQYTAASIVSQNKQLAVPASIDSITSSNGQEDHVSMGANAATKLYHIIGNVHTILAIELMNAAQAFELRADWQTSPGLQKLLAAYREKVAFLQEDRLLHEDIVASREFLTSYVV